MHPLRRASGTDLETECAREQDERVFNDYRTEERICALSWADELRLYQCYWRDSLHCSTIEVKPVCSDQLSGRETRQLAAERGHKGRGWKNYITRCAMNRVALGKDLIGDDNSASVENGGF